MKKMQALELRALLVWLALIGMIAFNAAAQILPLNGVTTGEVSDRYQIFVIPAGYAFSIWSVIYLGLIGYATRRSLPSQSRRKRLADIDAPFLLGCAANVAWLWLWHHGFIAASLAAMLALLGSLIVVYRHLGRERARDMADFCTIDAPFGLYTGWVTVATLVNLSVVLEHHAMRPFDLDAAAWAVLMLIVATLVAVGVTTRQRDPVYLAAVLWAAIGIAIAPRQQPTVAMTAWVSVCVLAALAIWAAADHLRARVAL